MNRIGTSLSLKQFVRPDGYHLVEAESLIDWQFVGKGSIILVCNQKQRVIGYISTQQQDYLTQIHKCLSSSPKLSYSKFMTPVNDSLQLSSNCEQSWQILQKSSLDLLPVYDEAALVGIIYKNDLMNCFYKQLKASDQALHQLQIELQQKEEYLGILSHDIRTPLGVISLSCELLLSEKHRSRFDADTQTFLERIQRNVNNAVEMAQEIMQVLRLEDGGQMRYRETEIYAFLQQEIKNLQILAAKKNMEVVLDCPQEIIITIDPVRIQHVLVNLLSNAVKFSPPGKKVYIRTELERQAEDDFLILTVIDEGPGISEEQLPFIFQKYEQFASKVDSNSEGVGLGLAIVQKFVAFHGGHIKVESELGKGSSFKVYLPGAKLKNDASDEARYPDKPLLLLVEDDEDLLDYFAHGLSKAGYQVVTAINGEQAYQQFLHWKPDIILSDIKMPKRDGFELLAMVRNQRSEIPIILFTGFYPGLDEDLANASFQASAVLSKPATVDEVLQTLRKFLDPAPLLKIS